MTPANIKGKKINKAFIHKPQVSTCNKRNVVIPIDTPDKLSTECITPECIGTTQLSERLTIHS